MAAKIGGHPDKEATDETEVLLRGTENERYCFHRAENKSEKPEMETVWPGLACQGVLCRWFCYRQAERWALLFCLSSCPLSRGASTFGLLGEERNTSHGYSGNCTRNHLVLSLPLATGIVSSPLCKNPDGLESDKSRPSHSLRRTRTKQGCTDRQGSAADGISIFMTTSREQI